MFQQTVKFQVWVKPVLYSDFSGTFSNDAVINSNKGRKLNGMH